MIAKRVGHNSVNTTMNIYGHLYPDKQKQLAEMLNAEAIGEKAASVISMMTEESLRLAGGWR